MFARKKDKKASGWSSARPDGGSSSTSSSRDHGIVVGGHHPEEALQFALLPNEVAEHILRFVSVRDLFSALLVCRQWHALIELFPQWRQARERHSRSGRQSKRIPTKDDTYKIVMLGPGGAGRNSFILMFAHGIFPDKYDPVIEDSYNPSLQSYAVLHLSYPTHSYRKQFTVDGVPALADLIITAGQEEYSAMIDQYVRTTEGVLVLYDVTWVKSIEYAEHYLEKVHRLREVLPPIVLLGNKLDLADQRAVTPAEGKALADKWAAYSWGLGPKRRGKNKTEKFRFARNFFECSVKEGYVVEYDHDACKLWSEIPPDEQPPAESADGKWRMHRGQMEVVFEELVRQIDMHRAAKAGQVLSPGKSFDEREDGNKKCMLM